MIANTTPAVYNDFENMVNLRQEAQSDPQATLKKVAQHFESIYMNMMIKSMRQASLGDPIFDSNSGGMYRDMYDSQLALQMSQQNGIGLADMLVKQLQGGVGNTVTGENSEVTEKINTEPNTSLVENLNKKFIKSDPVYFSSHSDFVKTLMPYAEEATEEMEVTPQVLIAQAALETGWGQHIQKLPNGKSSYNLFNIKADSRWNGDSLKTKTLEYHGVAQQQNASFRVYGSYAESFRDYVNFIKTNPRYEIALETVADPESYAQELQNAGYATDPKYADKIIDIYQREVVAAPFSEFLAES